ncbi:hypothetical protein ANO11243_028230 [Dothideomycetidae sp. 11243]|nr:hypothetical protein ANO11243_028230 [fungal sp. No.11243]
MFSAQKSLPHQHALHPPSPVDSCTAPQRSRNIDLDRTILRAAIQGAKTAEDDWAALRQEFSTTDHYLIAMATACVARPWTDNTHLAGHSSPLTPAVRRVSGKRKRDSANEVTSRTPLVNERYTLLNGADTPGTISKTPGLGGYRTTWDIDARHATPIAGRRSWSVTGMVGSVFGFCYALLGERGVAPSDEDFDLRRRPLPGMFPFEDDEETDSPLPPAKRAHTDLGNEWVVVDSPASTASRASSRRPSAPRSRKRVTGGSSGSPAVVRRQSSVASMRSPAARPLRSRRSQPVLVAQEVLEERHHRSSLSPEAQRLVVQREKRDKNADLSMRKMSRQVQMLIKQGQMALGSSFEVEGGSESEGDS